MESLRNALRPAALPPRAPTLGAAEAADDSEEVLRETIVLDLTIEGRGGIY